ncbi:NUDIX domain-containing protein [Aquincola tertiaricarbonis]|uniref:NUDIX domain-containing protein n=1 Tax=Aquincola tertiaricarbonis TaxID=391953 RepID=UPI000614B85C|nr:NUDIX domain-containing protein [Aquincola tertiaricarbonis]
MAARTTSYGVIVSDEQGQVLLAHATGSRWWDLPKGGAEPGETPRQAAVREVLEETGLVLAPASLTEIGLLAYRPQKSLHLFRTQLPASQCDLSGCACTSFFPHHRTGAMTPEVDAWRWAAPTELPVLCAPAMVRLLAALGVCPPAPDQA